MLLKVSLLFCRARMSRRAVTKAACLLGTSALLIYAVVYSSVFFRNPSSHLFPRVERAPVNAILDKLDGIERWIYRIGESVQENVSDWCELYSFLENNIKKIRPHFLSKQLYPIRETTPISVLHPVGI